METDASNIPLPTNEDLSPTEQDLLDEYERLAENMKTVCLPTLFSSLFLLSPLALSPSHLCPSPFFLPYPNSITWLIKLTKVRNSSRTLSKQCPITPQLTSLIICANWSGKQVWFFTLLKASVYSIVLQQQISEERNDDGGGEGSEEGDYE